MSYVPVHLHLDYSNNGQIKDSVITVDNAVQRLKEIGATACAVTDHGTTSGIADAYKKFKKAGIKLIPGYEGYLTGDLSIQQRDLSHITLWAKDTKGLENLYEISTHANGNKGLSPNNYYYKPRVDLDLLRQYSEGVMVGSACLGGCLVTKKYDVNHAILTSLIDIYGIDDIFLELHTYQCEEQYKYNHELVRAALQSGIRLVVATDAHFTRKTDADLRKYFKNTSKDKDGDENIDDTLYIQTADEIRSNLSYLDVNVVNEAIANTNVLAKKSNVDITFGGKHYPEYACENPLAEVRLQALEGWNVLVKDTGVDYKEYADRVKFELSVLDKQDYCSYFLINSSLIKKFKAAGIPVGDGRGSVVASAVAWLLGITKLDPIKNKLVFERFAHNERSSPPDVDTDISKKHRQRALAIIEKEYGESYQCRTFARYGASGSIRQAGKALGYPQDVIDALAKSLSKYESEDEDDDTSTYDQKMWMLDNVRTDENSDLIDLAKRFVGICYGYGKHASAIIVLTENVLQFCSVERQKDSKSGEINYICACDFKLLEDMGLMKLDMLGLKTLDVIHDTLESLSVPIDIEKISLDDELTSQMLCEGKTKGCFQISSPGMTQLVKGIQPKSFDDMIPLVALYRPGPLDAIVEETGDTMVETYVKVKNGEIEPTYLHEKLEHILEDTGGIILYQEQILEIVKELCGYSLGEADMFRRIIGKKKIDEMKPEIDRMIERGVTNGIPRDIMETIADRIITFALYGFNKSHSAAYGKLAYKTSYLKAHYPLEYMCALINNEEGKQDKILPYIKECTKLNIQILPPDITKKNRDWIIENSALRMGLHYIKGIGNNLKLDYIDTYESIVSHNPKDVTTALIKAGAMDFLEESRGSMLSKLSSMQDTLKHIDNCNAKIKENQDNLALAVDDKAIKKYSRQLKDWQGKLAEAKMQSIQGSDDNFDETIGEIEVLSYSEGIAPNIKVGKLTNVYSKTVSNGKLMGWVTLKSDYGEFRCSAFEEHWNQFKDLIVIGASYMFVCKNTDYGYNLEEISVNGVVYKKPERKWKPR